jgi:hypothetical protein
MLRTTLLLAAPALLLPLAPSLPTPQLHLLAASALLLPMSLAPTLLALL